MTAPPPFAMPGYEWDGKRFYKKLPGKQTRANGSSDQTASRLPKQAQATDRNTKHRRIGKQKMVDRHRGWPVLMEQDLGHITAGQAHARRHQLTCCAMARLAKAQSMSPACLSLSDSVTCIAFDDLDNNVVRVGTTNGTIATGYLKRPDADDGWFPNDEFAWRNTWMLSSKITSLSTCGQRFMATSFGSPAQALVSTSTDNVSLGSVVLSPRKTSLWSAAQTDRFVALGCDNGVLVSRDPSTPAMDNFVTGGKGGGGAVFALDATENLIFAGTRKGHVKVFDARASAGGTKPEMQLSASSSVTHCRRISNGLVVASIDGGLDLRDIRFPKHGSCVHNMTGHRNSTALELGLDVWNDEFVAASGDDGRIRIWSLLTGTPLEAPPSKPLSDEPESILSKKFSKKFSSPIRSVTFAGPDALPRWHRTDSGTVSSGAWRRYLERADGARGKGPVLWIADGPDLDMYDLSGLNVP